MISPDLRTPNRFFEQSQKIPSRLSDCANPTKLICSLLLCFTSYCISYVFAQTKNGVQFTRLNTLNGLSQSTVSCILKDRYGFMWFGTANGLNKYDGYKFKVYRNNAKDATSIISNDISCLYEDRAGKLWIGTSGKGLVLYDRSKDSFSSVGLSGKPDEILSDNAITSIYEDKKGNFWIGTFSNLNLLDRKTNKVTHFAYNPTDTGSLSSTIVSCLFEDSRGNFWVGTHRGLNLMDRKTGKFTKYFEQPNSANQISSDVITAIAQDKKGTLWIGTAGGLNQYNYAANTFRAYKANNQNPNALKSNAIHTICIGEGNTVWVGTEKALDLFDTNTALFTHYTKNPRDERSISHSSIVSLLVDGQGILWVGTFAGGVSKYDKNQSNFTLYRGFGLENSNSNVVTSFAEAANGDIWVGTDGGGLYLWQLAYNYFMPYDASTNNKDKVGSSILSLLLNRKKDRLWIGTYDKGVASLKVSTGEITYYHADKINSNSVYALLEDKRGNIWIGTNGGGVSVLNPVTKELKHFQNEPNKASLGNNFIRAFYEDVQGDIWIGTYSGGISVLNPSTNKFTQYNSFNSNLQSEIIYSIYGDTKNNIWVGTKGGGLLLFDRNKNNFRAITENQGLASSVVNSIVEDRQHNLWIGTDNGLSRFSPTSKALKNYTVVNGLQSNEFIPGSAFRTSKGDMLFGGLNGFNNFDPKAIRDNKRIPPVVITDFLLFNKSVPIANSNSPLKLNINETQEIVLSYDQSVFAIEFAALSYTVPEENKYAYMLEGFDEDWNYVGQERKATYTNLAPGKYTFKVKAANNDGLWNEEGTAMSIVITPPFWKTNWAYLLYFLTISGILYAIYVEIKSREKLKSEVLYQTITADKMQELNQLKLNFFTNISHELRTPLSLIVDPLRKIITEEMNVDQAKRYSRLVFKNATRLTNLVNQLLDFRKLETGHLQLEPKKIDVITLIKNVFEAFALRADERAITYVLDLKLTHLDAWIDSDKLDKILTNLISNAFKYTPDSGLITVSVNMNELLEENGDAKNVIEIHIKDTGAGIPSELKDKIFDIFYQVKDAERYEKESSGIGLALTKELVLLHKGEVFVNSVAGEGADFVVKIPVGEEHFLHSEPNSVQERNIGVESFELDQVGNEVAMVSNEANSELPIILIVEDNEDLREYIAEELAGNYQVEQASDGFEGFETALKLIPDLVISDIMMPVCTGLELCMKLKTDEKTSHIPIILLTAKQTEENIIEGYTTGADAYISKPFNTQVLAVRIKNLLDSRKKLRELYAKKDNELPKPSMPDIDVLFLNKAAKIVEENLSNMHFDIDKLAEELLMSRRQLYRKLSALTNQTAHDFITHIRLEKASDLLLTGNFTISEIAYQVGYSEPANFTRSFTKEYGMSPKKYVSSTALK